MIFKVLGSAGAESPGSKSPAFLIDGRVLLDAGTIGTALTEIEQRKIRHILITHAHLDHVKAIPSLADNIAIANKKHGVVIMGVSGALKTLRRHLLNNRLWPDFTKICAQMEPVISLRTIQPGNTFSLDGYRITPFRVRHTVPAVGYRVVNRRERTLFYTGDTGPTHGLWKAVGTVHALIIEVSFPTELEPLALLTRHMTTAMLDRELDQFEQLPEHIYITHPKPQYRQKIQAELRQLARRRKLAITMLMDGESYRV